MPEKKFSKEQKKFMVLALSLAERSRNLTGYDPAVGCVIVKNNKIIATGSHGEVSTPHAEVKALKNAGAAARGADLYINLEPCSHWGNNPPCVDSIIRSGVRRVFVATGDPNPLVNGQGFKRLRQAGIEVISGLLEKEAQKINEAFFKFIRKKIPFVTLKIAASLDGKIATATGQSQWLTGKKSRELVHYLRSLHQAVMVGTRTVLVDNPRLTARYRRVKYQPLRVVLDAYGKIPLTARVFNREAPTLLVISERFPGQRQKQLAKKGLEIIKAPQINGFFDLKKLLKILGQKKIASLLVEGGSGLLGSFVTNKLADKIIIFLAPLVIGGTQSLPAIGGRDIKLLSEAYRLKNLTFQKAGPDLVIEGYFV